MKNIDDFVAGFQRFQSQYAGDDAHLLTQLQEGQNPSALVVACCDSRVDPAILTGAEPGDLFVVRNVANLVPPYKHEAEAPGIRSAIEFAVKSLRVQHIIVLGHSGCGGIKALMDGEGITENKFEFIGAWVKIAARAREKVLSELPDKSPEVQARACEQEAILISLQNLLSFPWVREMVENKTLALHGWYFDIAAGELSAYSKETSSFAPLVAGSDPA